MKHYWALKILINATHVVAALVGVVAAMLLISTLATWNPAMKPDFMAVLYVFSVFFFVVFIEAQAQLLQLLIDIAHNTEKET